MSMAYPVARSLARCAFFCLTAAALLAGCASNGNSNSNSTLPQAGSSRGEQEIKTDFDTSDVRKRARIRLELALGYFQHGETTVALDQIKQALATDPNYAAAYNLRGLVYMRLDDPGLAEDSFRRAISLDPRDPDAMHNYGWLLCQQKRYGDADKQFEQALAMPNYSDRSKTLMTRGICQLQAGDRVRAEDSLKQAYEIDAANPVIGYNLALLLTQRNEWTRAQFYIRRVNNGPSANAESLWLGVKVEHKLGNREAEGQLADQLQRRFPQSKETLAYERGNFND